MSTTRAIQPAIEQTFTTHEINMELDKFPITKSANPVYDCNEFNIYQSLIEAIADKAEKNATSKILAVANAHFTIYLTQKRDHDFRMNKLKTIALTKPEWTAITIKSEHLNDFLTFAKYLQNKKIDPYTTWKNHFKNEEWVKYCNNVRLPVDIPQK
jgi:hypothetical protein